MKYGAAIVQSEIMVRIIEDDDHVAWVAIADVFQLANPTPSGHIRDIQRHLPRCIRNSKDFYHFGGKATFVTLHDAVEYICKNCQHDRASKLQQDILDAAYDVLGADKQDAPKEDTSSELAETLARVQVELDEIRKDRDLLSQEVSRMHAVNAELSMERDALRKKVKDIASMKATFLKYAEALRD